MTAPEVLRIDDMRLVLAAIRERGVRVDPLFAGECRQLFGNIGTRLRYCRKAGRTIDEVGELLWDRGFTTRRVSTVECLDLLETLFTPGVSTRVAQPSNRQIEKAAAKARSTRLRKFEMPRLPSDCARDSRINAHLRTVLRAGARDHAYGPRRSVAGRDFGACSMSERWQRIASNDQVGKTFVNTYRLYVRGGWIVRTSEQCAIGFTVSISTSSVFVPDENHEWKADEL